MAIPEHTIGSKLRRGKKLCSRFNVAVEDLLLARRDGQNETYSLSKEKEATVSGRSPERSPRFEKMHEIRVLQPEDLRRHDPGNSWKLREVRQCKRDHHRAPERGNCSLCR